MVNVNTQVASGVDFPSGESSLFTSAGSDPGRERHPRLPGSHGLHPGGVSEPRRPLKELLNQRAWWGRRRLPSSIWPYCRMGTGFLSIRAENRQFSGRSEMKHKHLQLRILQFGAQLSFF